MSNRYLRNLARSSNALISCIFLPGYRVRVAMRIVLLISCLWAIAAAPAVELASPPAVELTSSNATVHWRTDVASGTRVQVFPASARVVVPDKTPAVEHTVVLTGLVPGASYSVMIGSARVWLATNTFTATGAAKSAAPAVLAGATSGASPVSVEKSKAPPTRRIWGHLPSLPDHFARHGADFHARDADEYARMSWEFLRRARSEGLPAKLDEDGVLRVFDSRSGAFAAYNRNGTTKTYFKPGSRDYFERQPGRSIDVKTWKPE